jgi:MarR family 2-MHQ and catechol resistance regulon transcriptional repressor
LTTQTLALTAFVRLLRGHASVTRALNAQLQAEFGLTINDYEALLRLAEAEEGRMRRIDLANELVLTASGVTRLLEGLERTGYVKKAACATDARVTYAVLTDTGRDRFEKASRAHVASIRALFAERFDDAELDTLGRLLGRLPDAGAPDDDSCEP